MTRSVSEKICELRKARSLTQEKLGSMLGISSQAVSKWEKGESMPDILILPKLCSILGTSVDALLEMPVAPRDKEDILKEFCAYAREKGRNEVLLDAAARMFGDTGTASPCSHVDLGSDYLRVYDQSGMSFVVGQGAYFDKCLNYNLEELAYVLRLLLSERVMAVLRLISIDKAVTREELSTHTGLEESALDHILTGLFKRGLIVFEKDAEGKRGYLQSDAMSLHDSGRMRGDKWHGNRIRI